MNNSNEPIKTISNKWPALDSRQASEAIMKRASEVVASLIELRGHDRPPFLPKELAPLLGITKIETRDLGKTSALLLRYSNSYKVILNEGDSQVRQNFSFAHEMGHILFSDLGLEEYVKTIEYRTYNPPARMEARAKARERLCDAAATELLMPSVVFKKYLSTFGCNVNSISRLANTFKASAQTTALRMVELSNVPCVILLWKPWPLIKPRGFRLAWPIKSNLVNSGFKPVHTYVRSPSSLDKACYEDRSVKSFRNFVMSDSIARLPVESKGFGPDNYRYVISLVFPENLNQL